MHDTIYKITKNALSENVIEKIHDYIKNHDPVMEEHSYSKDTECEKYGAPISHSHNEVWRSHTGIRLNDDLIKIIEKEFLAAVTIDGIYNYVTPSLGADAFINISKPGDFLKEHIDPPTSVWDTKRRLRRANYNIMLSENFSGGQTIVNGIELEKTKIGDVTVFPQPLPHAVEKVTNGERIVVFGWIYDMGIPNELGLEHSNKEALKQYHNYGPKNFN